MYSTMKPWQRVLKGLKEKNPTLYWIARFMLSDLGKMIDKLTRVNRVGYLARLANEVKWDEQRFSKNINKLASLGFGFTTHFWLHRIGLMEYFIFVDEFIDFNNILPKIRSWIRSYARTFSPKGTIIVLYMPYNYADLLSYITKKWLKENYSDNIIAFLAIDLVLQPSFTRYKFDEHPLYRGYKYSELERIFNNADEEFPENIIDNYRLKREVSYPTDIIDLLIMKELEKDGLTTLRDISTAYGYDMGRLRDHLDEHIIENGLVKGIYLKRLIYVKAFGSPLLLLLKIRGEKLYTKWINFFAKLENTLFIEYSPFKSKKYYLYIGLTYSLGGLNSVKTFIANSLDEGFLEDIIAMDYIPSSVRKFTVPYKNYLQDKRQWDIDVDKTHMLFERRILRKRE